MSNKEKISPVKKELKVNCCSSILLAKTAIFLKEKRIKFLEEKIFELRMTISFFAETGTASIFPRDLIRLIKMEERLSRLEKETSFIYSKKNLIEYFPED